MEIAQAINSYWVPLTGMLGLVAWIIRLEAKILYLEKDHEADKIRSGQNDANLWDKMNSIQSTMNSIQQSLARIEGRMEHNGG